MKTKNKEIKIIFAAVVLLFAAFLIYPVVRLLVKSFVGADGERIFTGAWQQLSGCGCEWTAHNGSCNFPVVYHSLYECSWWSEKTDPRSGNTSDVASNPDLWICDYLFFWKAGSSDTAVWTSAV